MADKIPHSYFVFQSAFMNEQIQSLETISDIKKMMERSSRFISLSGWSGVAAGVCALIGACIANRFIHPHTRGIFQKDPLEWMDFSSSKNIVDSFPTTLQGILSSPLAWIAAGTFIAAFGSAFFFTWQKSKKQGIPIWGSTSIRLMISVAVPMTAATIFFYRMIDLGLFGLVAPACLLFYGLALLNASKYTFREIRYLGLAQIILGLINAWEIGYGLYFWAFGFGILHIVYGIVMWYKYERTTI